MPPLPSAGRLALLGALLLGPAALAQPQEDLGGTWYVSQDAHVVLRAGSDSTATDLAVTSLVTLTLHVDGTTVTGEETRALSIPAGETAHRKDPVTVATTRQVTGTLEGGTLRLTMTAAYGPALAYEGTLSPDDRHLTLRLVPEAGVRGEAPPVEAAPVTYDRQLPKPRVVK